MEIRPVTQEEWKYTYNQSLQLQGQTGNIGHLRGDFGGTGMEFYTTWHDHRKQWKTEAFRKGLDEVVNALRTEEYGLLTDRKGMRAYAALFPESAFPGSYCTEYGFRVGKGEHSFLFRCNPEKGSYNFYCYCYVREWLDKHMENARQGIRFIDPHYKELFRIPDGGRIVVTDAGGKREARICRYIDDYHTEIGSNLYHICEFAERMDRIGAVYGPELKEHQHPFVRKAGRDREQER